MSQKTAIPPENKMGTMPVNKLLVSMAAPMIISMLVQALYNIVDSIFVAYISEAALTAVSLAFPLQNLMISVAVGTGVGVNALLSKSLGEKNFDQANKTASNSIFLALLSAIAFALIGIFGAGLFMRTQTDIPEIVEAGTTYIRICLILSFGTMFQIALEKLLQSTGKTMYTMVTQATGAIINIIFDPILIFGYFGVPAMGVAGAALATVFGQLVAALLALYFNLGVNKDIKIRLRGFRPDGPVIKKIYAVGAPSIIMQSVGSVMTFGVNRILLGFSATAAAVFGVYFKLQSFVFMPVFGINNGMVPIIAYNYGARKPERIRQTMKYSMLYAVAIMLLGLLIFWVFAAQLLGLFNASEAMVLMGVPALRIISLSFVFAGFCVVSLSVFQALGHGMFSLSVSIVRQIVVLLPVAWLLAQTGSLEAVWWAWPIAELVAVVMCVGFMKRVQRQDIRPLEESAAVAEAEGAVA